MSWFSRLLCLPCIFLVACGMKSQPVSPHLLASWQENKVTGEIWLVWDDSNQVQLQATFTPDAGCHLYSKDIPVEGIDGLGRPTLLGIVPGSPILPNGELTDSIAVIEEVDIPGLMVYPVGSVTLSLPVSLPEGEGWFDGQVTVTYMACQGGKCYPPVEAKIIPVNLPGWEEISGR